MSDRPGHRLPPEGADRNELLHAFSHDLKNRLAALWEAFHAAGTDQLSADELEAMAERSYFGSLQAIERLMDDLQVPRGQGRSGDARIDVRDLVSGVVEAEEYRWSRKQQRIVQDHSGGLIVHGDRGMLERLVGACFTNAIKFSPAGAEIRVATYGHEGSVRVVITDPGAGLTALDLEHLFERYRILGSRATPGESQGRGTLALALQWARQHGGDLAYTSQGPGKGSTCTITLPAVRG